MSRPETTSSSTSKILPSDANINSSNAIAFPENIKDSETLLISDELPKDLKNKATLIDEDKNEEIFSEIRLSKEEVRICISAVNS